MFIAGYAKLNQSGHLNDCKSYLRYFIGIIININIIIIIVHRNKTNNR